MGYTPVCATGRRRQRRKWFGLWGPMIWEREVQQCIGGSYSSPVYARWWERV